MQVEVRYVVEKNVTVEVTETMIRRLYEEFKNGLWCRSNIVDALDDYLREKSGYIKNNGMDFNYETDIEDLVDEIVDRIEMEEE